MNSLIHLFETNEIDEFTIHRARNEGIDLLNKNFTEDGTLILALVDSLLFDLDAFNKKYHEIQSISPETYSSVALINGLQRFGMRLEAYELALSLAKNKPDDIQLLKIARSVSLQSAKFESYIDFSKRLGKLGYEGDSDPEFYTTDAISPTVELMNKLGVSEGDFNEHVLLATRIIRDKNLPAIGVLFDTSFDGGVALRYVTPVDIETAIDISFEIAESLTSAFAESHYEILTLGCASKDELPS